MTTGATAVGVVAAGVSVEGSSRKMLVELGSGNILARIIAKRMKIQSPSHLVMFMVISHKGGEGGVFS